MIVHTRADQLLPQLLMELFDTCIHNVDTLNICMKEFGSQKLIIDKMTVMRTWTIFLDCVRGYSSTCAIIVHTRADQLLSQLLMDSLNTLLSHYRPIGNLHEEI